MRKLIALFLAAAAAVSAGCSADDSGTLVAGLDNTLLLKQTYDDSFNDRVDALRKVLGRENDYVSVFHLNERLAEEFRSYSFDSTKMYLNRNISLAQEVGDREGMTSAEIALAMEYVQAGSYSDAVAIMDKYSAGNVPGKLRKQYFEAAHTLAGEMMFYSSDLQIYRYQFSRRNTLRDSLLKYTSKESYGWYDLNREAALSAKDSVSAREFTSRMISLSEPGSRDYARACYYYAILFPDSDPNSRLEWLVRSAEADIKCATKDYAALNDVAMILFRKGDIDRAFRYVADHCMPDALFFNGKLRPWQISRFFPQLERAYESRQEKQQKVMMCIVLALTVLLVLLIVLIVKIFTHHLALSRANRELKSLNDRLQDSEKIKEEYLALFLGMMSDNINTTRKYKNHVLKYLRRGNDKYLIEEIELMPPIEDDVHQFYKMFDETFLNLFPDFVEQFNALLADGSAIILKDPDVLTPELRIFALIRLGVTDSGKIASLLHYSSNTVYNYRAKIKNKARGPRDSFEDAVRAIR